MVSWKLFSSATLSRFDLYYSRNNQSKDKIPGKEFLENCQRELKQINKNVSLEKNRKGWILKIGSRRSNNYSRIYETKNSLKFEHEMKGKFLQNYHLLLVKNRLDEFEQKLSSHFFFYFGKLLPLHFSYLDWLIIKLRPIRKQLIFQSGLNSDYIKSDISLNIKTFVMFLQFLTYVHDLDFEIEYLGGIPYRQVIFQVKDFLEYQKKSNNYYQLKKLIEFFDELQTNSLIKFFSDKEYRSLVTIPEVALTKGKQNCWVGRVWISEELFRYSHPFILPNLITKKLTKHEVEVQFKVIQVFSSVNIAKTFWIKDFFEDYSVKLTNQQKTKMKKYFIECLQQYKKHGLIDETYKILSKGTVYSTKELTSKIISEGFIVYEKLSI